MDVIFRSQLEGVSKSMHKEIKSVKKEIYPDFEWLNGGLEMEHILPKILSLAYEMKHFLYVDSN